MSEAGGYPAVLERLVQLLFIENERSTVSCYPQIQEEICQSHRSEGIDEQLLHWLDDIAIIAQPSPASIVELAYVIPSVRIDEPDRKVTGVSDNLA